jgi:hypothetical protein
VKAMVMSATALRFSAIPEHVRAVRDGLAASGLEGEVKLLGGGEDSVVSGVGHELIMLATRQTCQAESFTTRRFLARWLG